VNRQLLAELAGRAPLLPGAETLAFVDVGALIAVYGFGSMFSQLAGGFLTDKIGRRATLTAGMLANSVALLGLGYARGLAPLAVAATAAGFTTDVYRPASSALVADLVPDPDRARAYGLLFWVVNLGTSAAMVLGGMLARTGFTALFWTDAATCAIFGLLVWRLIPETLPPAGRADTVGEMAPERASAPPSRRARALGDPLMLSFALLTLLVMCVYMQAFSTLPLAMERSGLWPQAYGLAMAVNGLVIVAVQPVLGSWLGHRDATAVLASGIAAFGIGYGLLSLAASTWEYAACVAIWSIGEVLFTSIAPAVVAALAPPRLRGHYSGVFGMAFSVGYLIAPLAGTRLLAIGKPVLWLSCAGACATAVLWQLSLGPAIRRRKQVAAADNASQPSDAAAERR
jgi:MFS family permease